MAILITIIFSSLVVVFNSEVENFRYNTDISREITNILVPNQIFLYYSLFE